MDLGSRREQLDKASLIHSMRVAKSDPAAYKKVVAKLTEEGQ